jgi:hypothetical protein
MTRSLFAVAGLLAVASVSNAQYYYNNSVNPWNGTIVQASGVQNPYTGGYTTTRSAFNPYTGYSAQGYTTVNPFTGVRYDGIRRYSPFGGYQVYNTAAPAYPAFGFGYNPYTVGYGYRPYGYWR